MAIRWLVEINEKGNAEVKSWDREAEGNERRHKAEALCSSREAAQRVADRLNGAAAALKAKALQAPAPAPQAPAS
jgi:hypothetical protein